MTVMRKRKTKPTSERKPSAPGWMEEAFRAMGRPLLKAAPWAALAAAVTAGIAFGADRMRRAVSPGYEIHPASLARSERQTVGRLPVDFMVEPRGLPASLNALDRGVATVIAQAYARDPWVEEVRSVRILRPNRVEVSLACRMPVAFVVVDQTYYWVDRTGVRVPGEFPDRMPSEAGLLLIYGTSGPVPEPGQSWPDPGVRPGAEIAVTLQNDARALDLVVIDVSNIDGRRDPKLSEIVLFNRRGTRILWGRPPSTDRPGELAPADKLRQLRAAAREHLLDRGGFVDIRFPGRVVERPAEAR
jgi:hypothetical protein